MQTVSQIIQTSSICASTSPAQLIHTSYHHHQQAVIRIKRHPLPIQQLYDHHPPTSGKPVTTPAPATGPQITSSPA